jgi:hypothetical protein
MHLHPWKESELQSATAQLLRRQTASGTWYTLEQHTPGAESAVNVHSLRTFDLTMPGNVLSLLRPALASGGQMFGESRDLATSLCARAEVAESVRCGVCVTPEDFEALNLAPFIDPEAFDAAIMCWVLGEERGSRLCVWNHSPGPDFRA